MNLPRGMKDFEGPDSGGIEHIRGEFMRMCGLYGFEHVDPSPLEYLSTLETRSGPAIRDEIYHFEDKGGRQVALRFDFTMGLARRAASQRSERLPSKVSSFGGVFRYDEPQKGRYRYFHQWDAEVFGRPTAEADAEIIEMTALLFESLGMGDVSIQVSHRDLIESKVREVFGRDATGHRVAEVLRAVDKTAKKPREEIIRQYVGGGHDDDDDARPLQDDAASMLGQVLDFAGIRGGAGDVARAAPGIESLEGWDRLAAILDMLSGRGISNVEVNLGIVRGLDYYSGMVFEVFDARGGTAAAAAGHDGQDSGQLGALAGGGRYDALTAAFGRGDLGAAGAAGGVERTILAMRERGLLDDDDDGAGRPAGDTVVAVLYTSPEFAEQAARVAAALRRGGVAAEFDIAGRGLKKQLGNASRRGISLAIIIGLRGDDVATATAESASVDDDARPDPGNHAVLRKMNDKTQSVVKIDDLLRDPRGFLSGIS